MTASLAGGRCSISRSGPTRLVLGLPDDRDLVDLVELVGRGIHPADEMPFLHPFTAPPSPERERGVLSFQWQTRGSVTPEHWNLSFVVLAGVDEARRQLGC